MASTGLTQRRRGAAGNDMTEYDTDDYSAAADGGAFPKDGGAHASTGGTGSAQAIDTNGQSFYNQEGYDDDEKVDGVGKRGRKLTLMEEVLLLGYKDNELLAYLPFVLIQYFGTNYYENGLVQFIVHES
ncbi:hypothetical protein BDEG_27385 [Batrachochytrium dendrobatidis JEL423]|uniref:Uncharacterized protein n=1 Tax=Batrachochytrium dendrobatidis (strain JEL423) TaxID=403673 RepID=A0A177WXL4_BATDL|nr:hypothetical protein BDEG_27385 [Batrachochytrium dendrobatidis JEL423]